MAPEVKIKICGIKTPEMALKAVESGADLLGLVFYPPSPRFLTDEAAAGLVESIAGFERKPGLVGLFVNVPLEEMARKAEQYGLDYLQLSGDETPAQVAEISRVRPVIRALRLPATIEPEAALELAAPFGSLPGVTLLLDTHKQGMYGGTGQTGDWQAARAIAQNYPTLLAGGLKPGNVAQAVELVRPWGVDVSSGVEMDGAPGVKDPLKIEQFCHAARFDAALNRAEK
ncbi:MAG: phosphoribosylanthranilate isomerase [Chloroflexi bacterium]|nr:phosphoribosylanthranilate isomerase [Chloroflexota bacterium]